MPKPIAAAGAWLETKSEPVVPDALDYGEKPFIRPFMIEMASDHYELDISRGPKPFWAGVRSTTSAIPLPAMIDALKSDPLWLV